MSDLVEVSYQDLKRCNSSVIAKKKLTKGTKKEKKANQICNTDFFHFFVCFMRQSLKYFSLVLLDMGRSFEALSFVTKSNLCSCHLVLE